MTCLVALRHARGVVLGADAALDFDDARVRTRKIFRRGQLVLALAGSCTSIDDMLAAVRDAPTAPDDFAMWAAYRPGDASGFVACDGEVAEFGAQHCEPVVDYAATGADYTLALGAMHYARSQGHSPGAAVVGALRAAAIHGHQTMGPYTVVHLPADRWEIVR